MNQSGGQGASKMEKNLWTGQCVRTNEIWEIYN